MLPSSRCSLLVGRQHRQHLSGPHTGHRVSAQVPGHTTEQPAQKRCRGSRLHRVLPQCQCMKVWHPAHDVPPVLHDWRGHSSATPHMPHTDSTSHRQNKPPQHTHRLIIRPHDSHSTCCSPVLLVPLASHIRARLAIAPCSPRALPPPPFPAELLPGARPLREYDRGLRGPAAAAIRRASPVTGQPVRSTRPKKRKPCCLRSLRVGRAGAMSCSSKESIPERDESIAGPRRGLQKRLEEKSCFRARVATFRNPREGETCACLRAGASVRESEGSRLHEH